jgi:4-hydroxy-tetrahydrodipicolinate synthase
MSAERLKGCAAYKDFVFLKDTSCNIDSIKAKISAVHATNLKLFNANSATLLDSLKLGAAGFSGVMANIHPELYVWLISNWRDQPKRAEKLMDFLSMASLLETQLYPACAKYYLVLEGVLDNIVCRSLLDCQFTDVQRLQVEQLRRLTHCVSDDVGITRSGSF